MSIKQVYGKYREWVNKHAILVTLVVVGIIAAALYAIYRESEPGDPVVPIFNAYFYDLETGKIFVARMSEPSPISVPGAAPGAKPSGVKANVFACRDCADEKDRFVAFVETYSPEAKARALALAGNSPTKPATNPSFEEMERGHLIARPDPANPDWKNQFYEYMSPEGNKIMESAQRKCGDGVFPKICLPEQDHFR